MAEVFRILKSPCQSCGTYHTCDCSTCPTRLSCPEPRAAAARGELTDVERDAVANGWPLDDFRATVKLGPEGLKALFALAAPPAPPDLTGAIRHARRAEPADEHIERLAGQFRAARSPISAAPSEPRAASGSAPAPPSLTEALKTRR